MLFFENLLAHLAGDYLIQSDWMATEKVKRWGPRSCMAPRMGCRSC
ncbi:DUF3307 domain-containing protein [Streptomyces chattanoogensis]